MTDFIIRKIKDVCKLSDQFNSDSIIIDNEEVKYGSYSNSYQKIDNVNMKYVYYYLYHYLDDNDIENIEIKFPSVHEQTAIVNRLDFLNKLNDTAVSRISDLKMQKDFYVDNFHKGTIDYCELSDYIDKNDNRIEELEKDIDESEILAIQFISGIIEPDE